MLDCRERGERGVGAILFPEGAEWISESWSGSEEVSVLAMTLLWLFLRPDESSLLNITAPSSVRMDWILGAMRSRSLKSTARERRIKWMGTRNVFLWLSGYVCHCCGGVLPVGKDDGEEGEGDEARKRGEEREHEGCGSTTITS